MPKGLAITLPSKVSFLSLEVEMLIIVAGGEQFVHCREVVHSSGCPLSEVLLHSVLLVVNYNCLSLSLSLSELTTTYQKPQ